jgi:lactoylglutathione lyase
MTWLHESNEYAEMETGDTKLAFASKNLADSHGFDFGKLEQSAMTAPFELAFVTPNIEADFKSAVEKGATAVNQPVQKPWGQRVGYVRDCNGFLVEICSPME